MNRTILFIILTASFIAAKAQTYDVKLLCSPRQDSIMLRWAPANSETWRLGNEYGYVVERFTLLRNKKLLKEIESNRLTETPLKPAPIETWEKFADNKYVAIEAECIYGSFYKGVPTMGNPHIAYKKYKEEKHRFSFALYAADQSVKAAKLAGLYFVDKTAQPNEKYLYKVYIESPDSIQVDTASAFTALSEYQPLPKPLELKAEWGDREVTLSWNIQYLKHVYNSYIVEKSLDEGKTYFKLGDNASVQLSDEGVSPNTMFKTDSFPKNDITIYYRVRGISAFGELSPPSDSVFGHGILPLASGPIIVSNDVVENRKVDLQWVYPKAMNNYITGFKIYRSPKPEGRKKVVYNGKDPEVRAFMDTSPGSTNYYLISVYNEKEEKFSSLVTYAELVDSFPPAPPVGLEGEIDSTGNVTITWKANTEEDIHGYRVYMANKPEFEFMLVTPSELTDTVFRDSINLKTLTKNIYYKVRAIDGRLNQSAFSEMLTLTRPDIIPPVSPVIKNIEENDGYPELTWVNSSSKDVAFHHIYRKTEEDTTYTLIKSFEKVEEARSTYIDNEIEKGAGYIYHIVAEDEAGLYSPPSNKGYYSVPSGIVESIKLKKKTYTDRVKLSWVIKSEKAVEKVLVYRAINDEPLRLYGNSNEDSFTDDKLSINKTYKYAVQAIYKDGSSSAFSEIITIKM